MNVQPLGNKVFLRENKKEAKSVGGIILEGVGNDDTKTGTVLAIGPDVKQVAIGDEVYLDWTKIQVIKDGDTYRALVSEEFINGIVKK